MAIDDLPLPVVNLLNVIGVPWPYIDEDTLREFASFTREFATAVQTTHDDATRTVRNIAAAYQGSATDAMNSGWAKLSARHVDEVLTACHVLADALDVAAVYVVGQKVEAIAILVDLAAAFIADQAAAIATAGIAEAAVPLIIAGAEKLVESLAADLEQYIIAMVIEAAAKPLLAKIEDALAGLDWSKSGAQVDEPDGFSIDPGAVALQVAVLRQQATTIGQHGTAFAAKIRALDF
jgi:type VII secretion system (Wss) protein ESAT-6